MTLQQLKYVVTAVRYGSISEAAKQLYISQPSLSNAVRELEKELGIEIFTRTSKGITLSTAGTEFLSYARQVLEQAELLEQRYLQKKPLKQLCSVSTQHYAFAVTAFVNLISSLNADEYEFTLRETRTYEIIQDVANFKSEIGILYLNDFNEKVLNKLIKENHLVFHPLFEAIPHVFVSVFHPLAGKQSVTMEDLEEYPCLCFEQGEYNSFYFSEEILSTVAHKKTIHVSDRATLFNFLIGLHGYTICTGVLNSDLNGDDIVSVPLQTKERMLVGWVVSARTRPGDFAIRYLTELKRLIVNYGFTVLDDAEYYKKSREKTDYLEERKGES